MVILFLNTMKKMIKKKLRFKLFLYLLIIPVFIIGYKINNMLVNSFGCFDDCHVYSTAYFMLSGKKIYSEVFFNHNPLMPFISVGVQYITSPSSIYELLLRHRQVLFFASVVFNILLLIRFRYKALGFIILFELTKFYTFGNRFLPEAIIVYPLVYLFGIGLEKLQQKKIYSIDFILTALACWFIVFMREPYVPLAIFLFLVILWKFNTKLKFFSLAIFTFLSVSFLLYLPIQDFYFNVVNFNLSETVGKEVSKSTFLGADILKIIFYPFYIFLPLGDFGFFRQLLIFESIFFVYLLIITVRNLNKKIVLFLFLTLGLSNIRFTEPGITFYAAYHMNVWYALFIFSLLFLLSQIKNFHMFRVGIVLFVGIIIFSLGKDSIIWQKIDQHEQLLTNYGPQMLHVQILEKLSDPKDTLFLDGWDELIYSQAKLPSPYKYSHFTSQMPNIPLYQKARSEMFVKNPPTFYYGTCREDVGQKLPGFVREKYVRIYHMGKPTCLYVLHKKYEKIDIVEYEISFENEQK